MNYEEQRQDLEKSAQELYETTWGPNVPTLKLRIAEWLDEIIEKIEQWPDQKGGYHDMGPILGELSQASQQIMILFPKVSQDTMFRLFKAALEINRKYCQEHS